jgi:hypothetical protein
MGLICSNFFVNVILLFGPVFITGVRVLMETAQKYVKPQQSHVIIGFRHQVDEKCALLGYFAASNGNSLLMFRYNLLVHLQGSRNVSSWIS